MTTTNPFPGMNPFFEQQWRDAHLVLIAYMRDALQEELPADLVVRAEEETVAIGAGRDPGRTFRPDVQVREPSPQESQGWSLRETAPATEPIRVLVEDEIERWLEIRDLKGRLITVIELPSPTNKREGLERNRYISKRNSFISGGVNVVEIDLVRQGNSVFPDPIQDTLRQSGACYAVCVFRAPRPAERELYPIRLRERLPAIRVPLRPADADAVLDLQPLIDRCHQRGRYHTLDYRSDLEPPLPPEDAAWAETLLREHSLR